MKLFSFAKLLTLGCFVGLLMPIACGDDDDDNTPAPSKGGSGGSGGKASAGDTGDGGADTTPTAGKGGMAGSAGMGGMSLNIPGTSTTNKSIMCGGAACMSTKTLLPTLFVDPCCTDDMACGVDTGFFAVVKADFKGECAAKMQEGPLDTACPDSKDQLLPVAGQMVPVPGFKGCCRAATGTCGVLVNDVNATGFGKFTSPNLGCVDSEPFFGKPGAACGGGEGGAGGGGGGAGMGGETSVGGVSSGGMGGAP